jgi:hypothetical protein
MIATWLDADHLVIGGNLHGPNALWRLHVGAAGLLGPPELVLDGGPDTQLSTYDAGDATVLLERETMSRRTRLIGLGGETGERNAPGALADFIPYVTDAATRHVLIASSGDPPRWLVLDVDDWSTADVPAPAGLAVYQADWRHGAVAALALGADGWHYLETDETTVLRDVALAGTAGLDNHHIGLRCGGARCVIRWRAGDPVTEVLVDDTGAAAPGPSPYPPGKSDDWAILPDGRRALIRHADHHSIDIVGGPAPETFASDTCHFAMTFVAADTAAVTLQCVDIDGTSRLVRIPLDGSPVREIAASPDVYLGAALVDSAHALVTSVVRAASTSVLDVPDR